LNGDCAVAVPHAVAATVSVKFQEDRFGQCDFVKLSADQVAETLAGGGLRSNGAIETASEGMGGEGSAWALRVNRLAG
jgi:hypothetical protein